MRICLKIVDLPDSPVPRRRSLTFSSSSLRSFSRLRSICRFCKSSSRGMTGGGGGGSSLLCSHPIVVFGWLVSLLEEEVVRVSWKVGYWWGCGGKMAGGTR